MTATDPTTAPAAAPARTASAGSGPVPRPRTPGVGTLRHGATLARRNLRHVARIPGRIVTGIVQPVMLVLLFAYVFGGSLGGRDYREFLLGGIIAQTMVFNSAFTTVGLANDVQRGIVERLRSLPVNPLALILGRTTADLAVTVVTLVVVSLTGLAVGWRVHGTVGGVALAYLLAIAFSFAMSWVGASIGLAARSVEVAQSAGLIWFFPSTLISTAFVSVEAMPGPLRLIAQWNPVSAVATTMRELFGNAVPPELARPPGWPAEHAGLYAVLASAGILVVFMPLALRLFRRRTAS